MTDETLEPGLYEHPVTTRLQGALVGVDDPKVEDLEPDLAASLLTGELHAHLRRAFDVLASGKGDDDAKVASQVDLTNAILELVRERTEAVDAGDSIDQPGRVLMGIPEAGPAHRIPDRPAAPLRESRLLVNARHEPRIGQELPREIDSADEILLVCAFLRWSGVRTLIDPIDQFIRRGGRMQLITTTYCGVTQTRAIDELVAVGVDVRVAYETQSTRLHAKAWLFERESGLSTAYIGSSNLSQSALTDGVEWNVRVAQTETPGLLDQFRKAFRSLWEDEHVEPYDRDRFLEGLTAEQRTREGGDDRVLWEITPFPFQRAILERLDTERHRHGRWQNLIVAATGTGKTVISALDYQRLRGQLGGDPTLLFIAHRKTILRQSRAVFQNATGIASFGEIYADGEAPTRWRHVFANVQSLSNFDLSRLDPTHFDVVIIDEFHHAAAPTYERLLAHFTPKVLVGLTATPERHDGQDVLKWFGGRFAAEIRLWDALDGQFLVPFHYFGIHDDVDLRSVTWRRAGYDTGELERLFTGNDARALRIVQQVRKRVDDPHTMRSLGFCVSREHARYMTERFNHHGIRSALVDGDTPDDERKAIVQRLESGEINCIFSVDVFTEGVDIPTVDTVLMLRPTESATVFLQQLGRGLRRAPGKSVCTVLDFIGNQRKEFRFGPRFMSMLGVTRTELERGVEDGFATLPTGVHFELDPIARATVLQNLKESISTRLRDQAAELRAMGEATTLSEFLEKSGRELTDVFRSGRKGWTGLRREAGFAVPAETPDQGRLTRAVNRLVYVDDEERIAAYLRFLRGDEPKSVREERLRAMFFLGLWTHNSSQEVVNLEDGLRRIYATGSVTHDLEVLLEYLNEESDRATYDEPSLPPDVPLRVHALYSAGDVLAAIGGVSPGSVHQLQGGVHYESALAADFFFINLDKSGGGFTPSTQYRDYAISRSLFHWETQSTQRPSTPTVQRYINHRERGSEVFLFVRRVKQLETGETAPYCFLGAVDYVSHEGERPVGITWKLRRPMPEAVLLDSVAVVG